jgi:hypothetical protein
MAGARIASWALTGPYSPSIDPASFVRTVDNRYFPLEPGTRFHYVGHKGATRQIDNMVVTRRTKRVLGVRSTIVRDTVFQHGKAIERTFYWYASGVNGAKPGIIMLGHPQRGDVYRQEYYPPGDALDQARVLGRNARRTVPYGSFKDRNRNGIVAAISVPPFGGLTTCKRPPTAARRSPSPTSPVPPGSAPPTPSSRTSTCSAPSSTQALTPALSACECLATLVSASATTK